MTSIESLVQYDTADIQTNIEIRTERVEPISTNTTDRRYIFRLEPQGFLSRSTMLQFKLSSTGTANLRVNSWNGALGAIKNVRFRVGDFLLNDIQSVNEWSTWAHLSPERREKMNRFWSWYFGNQLVSKIDQTVGAEYGQFITDETKNGYNYTTPASNSITMTTSSATSYKYGIPLWLLFPCLKDEDLPLFLFSEYKIYMEFDFAPSSEYVNGPTADTARCADTDVTISDVQVLADYIIYPSAYLEAFQQKTLKEGGYDFNFLDIVKVEQQLTVSAGSVTTVNSNALYQANGPLQNSTTSKEFRIGQEGREVHYVMMAKKNQSGATNNQNYKEKVFLDQRADGISSESIQWRINGVDIYPEPKTLTASQYDQNFMALKYRDLQVERPLFFNDPNSLAAGLTEYDSGLQGQYKPQSLDLRTKDYGVVGSGTQIGRYPLVLRYECTPAQTLVTYGKTDTGGQSSLREDGTYNVDFWVGVSRLANVINTGDTMLVTVKS